MDSNKDQDHNNEIKNNDNQVKSLNVIISGIRLAQSRGAFTLSESALLFEHMKTFIVDVTNEQNALLTKDSKP